MDKPKAAVTLADVAERMDGLTSRLDLFEQKMDLDLAALSEKVLTNVFRLAEALQSRLTEVERSDANLKRRLAMLEERLTEMEKRLNLPSTRVQ